MRVFISSTSEDLEAYRAAARDVVLHLGWQVEMMEYFGADGSAGVVDACTKRVGEADVALAILGWRRGGVPGTERGGDGVASYTKCEIDAALATDKPVLVFMADEMWPVRLSEDDSEAQAWVRTFRRELDRPAVFFEWEGAEAPLPVFQSKIREELLRHQRSLEDPSERSAETEVALRAWPEPSWPDGPYPLLLPYSHPALFAGRQRELEELRRLLLQPRPILGLYASSGAGKSSLLAAGLVPALRAERHPVAFDRGPDEPGLAERLIGDLLVADGDGDGSPRVEQDDPFAFADLLLAAERLSGRPPLLVLDQFEDLMRPDNAAARARLGLLLAASVRRRGGRDDPSCRWLLSYREDFHGRVSKWLRDVLAEARDRELPAAGQLPHDLARDRFHSWPLPLLGAPPPGGGRSNEPVRAFREAIQTPLGLITAGGDSRYPWRFGGDGAERLARAFAAARQAQPDAPLVPELQVVLAHLLKQTGEAEGSEPAVVEVPEKLEKVIGQALEGHLHRALDAAFLGQSAGVAREGRTLVLLALSQLADAEGKRGESLRDKELAKRIGDRGHEILEMLAQSDRRILVPVDRTDGRHYALSHDRLAEVVVRAVEEEGVHGELDRDLLGLRRFVRLNTELLRSNEQQATSIPSGDFREIAGRADALLWSEAERRWWKACQTRRQADLRRLTAWSAVVAITVVLIGLWIGLMVGRLEEKAQFVSDFASGQVEGILADVEEERRNREVLRAVEVALPRLQQRSQDLTLIGTVAWALDYFPGRDASLAGEARALRLKVLEPLRRLHPPPELPSGEESEWVEVPEGAFWMGSNEGEAFEDEWPRHRVTLSSFRMLDHEVTNEEFRRLVPGHEGTDDLPAVGVNWYKAYAYAAWLGGRLPTEAEWEYAARAGCPSDYCVEVDGEIREVSLDEVGWYTENSEGRRQPVRKKPANPWGLHDMYGNVREWVADWYGPYSAEEQVDPWGAPSGGNRVVRGGSYGFGARWARAANRVGLGPGFEVGGLGFRVVLPAAPSG